MESVNFLIFLIGLEKTEGEGRGEKKIIARKRRERRISNLRKDRVPNFT